MCGTSFGIFWNRRNMAVTILLAAAVAVYAGFVIRKKVKDIKNGKFCSCSGTCRECGRGCGGQKKNGEET